MNEMRILFLLHAALIYLPCLCVGVNVDQSPKLSVVEAGKPVELQCNSDDSTYYVMLWYQQRPGQGLKLMRYSTAQNDEKEPMEEGFKSWKWNRPTLLESSLKLDEPQLEDSAVYFCAVGTGNAQKLEFGAGTVLSVLEQGRDRIEPKVTIFNPNPKELEDHEHASFVCVASGFYPEHVSITWKVNEEKRQTYDQNKAKYNNNDKTYSISRRLSVTKDEYFNPSNTFRCEASFPDKVDKPVSKEVNGKPACSKAKKDQYRIEVNNGKLSYIMVLCKSAIYAIVVAAIMLRKKMKSSTY